MKFVYRQGIRGGKLGIGKNSKIIRRPKGRLIELLGFSAPDQGLFNFSVKGVVSPWPEKPGLRFL